MAKFKKGQSGNPGGKSKKRKDIEALAQKALEVEGDDEKNKAITSILKIAEDGDVAPKDRLAAWQILMAYAYGKPRQRHEHSGPDGGPIETKAAVVQYPINPRDDSNGE